MGFASLCQYSQLTFLSSTLFPYSQFSKGRSGSEPASAAAAVPLERKSSQPQKKPETVAAAAPATPATTGGPNQLILSFGFPANNNYLPELIIVVQRYLFCVLRRYHIVHTYTYRNR